uniref:CIDE-N domain-containing protein n=1 Tax=Leptobrachium leishanense TaxID=445787 RepID=A0A8C5QBB2_9ANUR
MFWEVMNRAGSWQWLVVQPEGSDHHVLAEDGTIVEDEDCFLCLPPKTKFMVLTGNKKWAAPSTVDGGMAWLAQESLEAQDNMDVEVLQDPLQRLLDRREEERQSKQLLYKLTQSGPGGTALLSASIIKGLREKELPYLS